jgi:catalase
MSEQNQVNENTKNEDLASYREDAGEILTTNQGVKVSDTDNSLKVGLRGPSLHDNFWDFISLTSEAMHMIMWVLSDRALPRSFRMMQGFGIHTFRFVNEQGKSHFVKFHWKPLLGVHSMVFDETQKIGGKDPDFNRRDLWSAIEMGDFPEYELGRVNARKFIPEMS